jgi:hypothetical protein
MRQSGQGHGERKEGFSNLFGFYSNSFDLNLTNF